MPPEDRLDSWKEIAAYLRTSVRTVQRWEKTEGLPVRRQRHARLGSVFAYRSELETWRQGRELLFDPADATGAQAEETVRGGIAGATSAGRGSGPDVAANAWESELLRLRERLTDEALPPVSSESATAQATVGRENEIDVLVHGFDEVAAGGARLLCIGGEAGIGKSTLLESFIDRLAAEEQPCVVARGRCSERLAGSEAYLPVLEALESLADGPHGNIIVAIMRLVAPTWWVQIAPLWVTADPAWEQVVTDAKAASQERMKRELASFVGELAGCHPVVLIIDDLHWADASTVELLAYLIKRSGPARMLVLSAYRTADLLINRHPFVGIRRELQERGLCRELAMQMLTREDVERYIDLAFPEHDIPPLTAEFIHRRTEGSPLFMADLLRHLCDRGVVVERDGRWSLARSLSSIERDLPQSVRSMIERKIDQLDDADRELLCTAAVQGQEFESAVVARVLSLDPAEVESRLGRLGAVHAFVTVLAERTLGREGSEQTISVRHRFVHVLYQNALIEALTVSRRTDLSRRTADALLELHGGDGRAVAAELALLYEAARDLERAADSFLQAAGNAARLYAHDEAEALAKRAIEAATQLPADAGHGRIRAGTLRLAGVFHTTGRYDEAVSAFARADALSSELGDPDGRIQAICGIATSYFYAKKLELSRNEALRALELACEHGSRRGTATAEAVLARGCLCLGDFAKAERLYAQAIPVLEEDGYTPQAIDATGYRVLMHAWRLDHDLVDRGCREWEQRSREIGTSGIATYFYRAMALGNAGRISEAEALAREGMRLAELNADPFFYSRFPNTLAWVHQEREDTEGAINLNRQNVRVIEMADGLDLAEPEANSRLNLAQNFMAVGELDAALDQLHHAQRLFDEDVWFRWRYYIRLQGEFAEHALLTEDLDTARSRASKALELATRAESPKHASRARSLLAEIALLEDRPDEAREQCNAAIVLVGQGRCPRSEWRATRILEQVERAVGNDHEADTAHDRVASIIDRLARSISDERARELFLNASRVRETLGS